jgi:hypothetical protein
MPASFDQGGRPPDVELCCIALGVIFWLIVGFWPDGAYLLQQPKTI